MVILFAVTKWLEQGPCVCWEMLKRSFVIPFRNGNLGRRVCRCFLVFKKKFAQPCKRYYESDFRISWLDRFQTILLLPVVDQHNREKRGHHHSKNSDDDGKKRRASSLCVLRNPLFWLRRRRRVAKPTCELVFYIHKAKASRQLYNNVWVTYRNSRIFWTACQHFSILFFFPPEKVKDLPFHGSSSVTMSNRWWIEMLFFFNGSVSSLGINVVFQKGDDDIIWHRYIFISKQMNKECQHRCQLMRQLSTSIWF